MGKRRNNNGPPERAGGPQGFSEQTASRRLTLRILELCAKDSWHVIHQFTLPALQEELRQTLQEEPPLLQALPW